MPSSGPVRRVLAVTAAFGLAVGIAALPGGPADAAVHTQFEASINAQATSTGSGNCWNSSNQSDQGKSSLPQNFTAGTHHSSVSMSATFTNTTNSSDKLVVSGHVASTLTVAKSGKDLKSFSLSSTGSISVSNTLGTSSQCRGAGSAFGITEIQFTEHSPGWLFISRALGKNQISVIEVENVKTMQPVAVDLGLGYPSRSTGQAFLGKGTYVILEAISGVDVGGDLSLRTAAGATRSSSVAAKLSAKFVKGGSPLSSTSGSGKRYVAFPSSVNCTTAMATLQWTGAAGKAKSGVFLVNGKQKGSTQSPFPGEKVSVKVPTSATVKLVARVKLKSGATVSASRSYYACKG